MRWLAALILACASLGAHAATYSCTPLRGEVKFDSSYLMVEVPNGPNGELGGWFSYWHCKQPDGTWKTAWGFCLNDSCNPPDWLTEAVRIAQSADRVAALDALLNSFTTVDCTTARYQYMCTQAAQIAAKTRPANPVPAQGWRVKAPGPRVVYTIAGGKRGPITSPAQYAAVGAACDPAVRVDEKLGNMTYMGVTINGVSGIAACEPAP